MHTVESGSKVWCTPWSLAQRYDAHCGVWLKGVMHTMESGSKVWSTPWSLAQSCDAHRGVWLKGMMHTMESGSNELCTVHTLESGSSLAWHPIVRPFSVMPTAYTFGKNHHNLFHNCSSYWNVHQNNGSKKSEQKLTTIFKDAQSISIKKNYNA